MDRGSRQGRLGTLEGSQVCPAWFTLAALRDSSGPPKPTRANCTDPKPGNLILDICSDVSTSWVPYITSFRARTAIPVAYIEEQVLDAPRYLQNCSRAAYGEIRPEPSRAAIMMIIPIEPPSQVWKNKVWKHRLTHFSPFSPLKQGGFLTRIKPALFGAKSCHTLHVHHIHTSHL